MAQNYVLLILGSDFGLRPLTACAVGVAQAKLAFIGATLCEGVALNLPQGTTSLDLIW